MRFKADGPAIPDILLDQRDAGNVVFLCGAGVSIPAGMPNFLGLAQHVTDEVDPPPDSKIRQALKTESLANGLPYSVDRVFEMLYQEYGREQVVNIVWERLSAATQECRPRPEGWEHGIIARLSANAEGHPQIVTTNFDRLFETALGERAIRIYEPPMYPDLRRPPTGITYLHGRLADTASDTHNYILSSADLGRAYLAEGWATKFVRDLLRRYTVVLLGYQAEDPPVSYLLQGLDSASQRARDRLFAFDKGDGKDVVDAKWSGRGVRAIPYGDDHEALWETLEAWAERADDPAAWRNAVVQSSANGPRRLAPHERGMVAHLVRSTTGAKQFANGKPAPAAEWLCVFDASCRYAQPATGFGKFLQPFDPLETYGLDDDPPRPHARARHNSSRGDDLISWRRGDDSVDRWQGLSRSRGPQHDPMPPRLFHLAGWLASCVNDPVLAWWVARQPALHPTLHRMLKRAVENSTDLIDGGRRGWRVLLEALESGTHPTADGNLVGLPKQIQERGWTPGLILEFEALTEPVFGAGPPMTLAEPRPPSDDWSNVEWKAVANLRIRFPPQWVSWPTVPEDDLPSVYAALERNLMRASERRREVSEIGWDVDDAHPDDRSNRNAYVSLFRELLVRLSTLDPDRVKQHIALWPDPDPRMFDRLRLFDAVATQEAHGVRDVETNEDASVLGGIPIGDIVRVALEHSGRTAPFVDKQPFTGLVKTRPSLAIRALGAAARRGEFPADLWSSALRHWPDNAPLRANRVLHGRLRRLPPVTIVAMPYPVGHWLRERFPDATSDDRVLAFGIFDHLVESLSTTGSEGTGSSRGEGTIGASGVQASRPTCARAINAPIGKAVEGLLQVLNRDNPKQGAGTSRRLPSPV